MTKESNWHLTNMHVSVDATEFDSSVLQFDKRSLRFSFFSFFQSANGDCDATLNDVTFAWIV